MQVSCRSEQTCRTSCFSIGRMLCHGGAPIWTALTVETGEITGISFPTAKVGPGPIRTLRPVRRVGIFFLEAISPWWSRSQNHRIFLFQTFPGTQSGESGMFPYHFVEMVLGWRASFPFPNSKLVAVRKFKKSEKGRCHKRDHKRAVPKFKKVYLTKKLPGKNYPWCKVFRPEKPCRKNYPTCKLFHIPY